MSRRFWLPLLATLALALGGCGILGEEEDETRDWSAQKLYTEAGDAMGVGDFEKAVDLYEKLEARYPFGKYAMQAQLNVAYAYYRFAEPESALAAVERFIKLYPNNPATAYALYLKGLINFNRSLSFMDRFIPTDTSQRDPGAAVESYKAFAELVRRFPDTEYAEDGRQRMIHLRNNLARHEVHVAQYYLARGAFVAAVNRAKYVVENYQRTPAVKPALEVMIEAYQRLELTELAQDAQRVLALNEEQGNFIPDPRDLEEKGWAREFWDFTELDQN
jgi:outer membrane protein assembly factor BamD